MSFRTPACIPSLLVLMVCAGAPAAAFAQGAIAGVVRDPSGAVLPGVTVEAASPALIEKVRVVVSDSEGVYRIVDLRPGTYTVSFTLPGFSTFVRDGILLEGAAVVTVNGELRVGVIEESITVTGETPIVDVQNTVKEQVLNRDLLDTIPTGRQVWTVGVTLPGVTLNGFDVGGSGGIQQTRMGVHGANQNETTIEIDGMIVNSNHGNGSTQHYFNDGMVQQMAFQTSANAAETQRGGVRLNMIPETGGNTFSGNVFTSAVPSDSWQTNNYDDTLRRAGLTAPIKTVHLHDYSSSMGGPIKRDSLWFFSSVRHIASNVANSDSIYPAQHPKAGEQVVSDDWILQGSSRVTWQAALEHKFTAYFERSKKVKGDDGGVGTAWEAMVRRPAEGRYYDLGQVKWTGAMSSRLLLESGWSFSGQNWTQECQEGVNEQRGTAPWFAKASRQDVILGTRWMACASNSLTRSTRQTMTSSVSYITGSHAFKTGVQWGFGPREQGRTANADLVQRYRNGVPDSVLVYNTPNSTYVYLNSDLGVYAQDAWKYRRATFNYGLRWDYFNAEVPELTVPGGRFFSERHFNRITLPTLRDFSPRFGVSYDVFGDGRTAIKAGINKYVNSEAADYALQYSPSVNADDARTWNDLNRDDLAQDNEIGPSNNLRFGIAQDRRPDPDLKRTYNIEYNASVERQLLSGLSASIGYYRRQYHRMRVQDNVLITPEDYAPVVIASPLNGEALTVYNLNRAKQGLVEIVDRNSDQRKQTYDGVELTFQIRTPGNGRILGGLTHDRTRHRNCSVDDPNSPSTAVTNEAGGGGRFCDQLGLDIPFQNLFKLTGYYPLPIWGIEVSGSYQSTPGSQANVVYNVGRGIIPALTQTSVNVQLVPAGEKYRSQVNQVDVSLAKSINAGGARRIRLHLDLFNALNSNVVLNSTETWGPNLDRPTDVLLGRLVRVGAQFRF